MTVQRVVLQLPSPLYRRASHAASVLQQPLDDALWEIAQSTMPTQQQEQLDILLDTQSIRSLTADEAAELENLRVEYGRILLRKARAYALLSERGHPLSELKIAAKGSE